MTGPSVYLRGELLDELGELIERRRLVENDTQAYIDTFVDDYRGGDRPGWVDAEVERLDEQIDRAARELVEDQ